MKRGGHKEEKFLQRFFFANSQICFFLGVNIQGVDHAEEQCPWQNKFDFGWVLMPRINVREGPMQGSQNLMSQSQPCSVSEVSPPSSPPVDLMLTSLSLCPALSCLKISPSHLAPSIIRPDLACRSGPVPHSDILCQCEKNCLKYLKYVFFPTAPFIDWLDWDI